MTKKIIEPENPVLTEYLDFLLEYQGLSEATLVIRRNFVKPFLSQLNIRNISELNKLSAQFIYSYIIKTGGPLHRASKKHLSSSIRSFLRFAFIKGYLTNNLVESVPVLTVRKLDYLPQSPSWESIEKLLTLPDRTTHAGRRDYAVVMLLIHYGVRIGQITNLKLKDIHWQESFIYFSGCKWSNDIQLPLHEDVAMALMDYITQDRKNNGFQEVFLTVRGQQRPLSKHNHYASNLKKYYVRAGINIPYSTSRLFRHAFATRLVNQKVPIKTIADLLGHRHIETTYIYTKVDYERLKLLAREWPEVE